MLTRIFLFLAALNLHAAAATWLPSCFTDHMVLQRDAPVPVWGRAEAGESVRIAFGAQEKNVTAGADGTWRMVLDPMPANAAPQTLRVTARESREYTDVLVGEVWLASGQSNMDFTVAKTEKYYFAGTEREAEEVAAANHPRLRMFTADWTMRDTPQQDVPGKWKVCNPENVREFSAVAYFHARELMQQLDVPVGILTCTYGASTVQAWMSRDSLTTLPVGMTMLERFDAAIQTYKSDPEKAAKYLSTLERYTAAAAAAKAAGTKAPRAPKNPDPVQDQHNPAVLWNGMLSSVAGYALRGAIWYQGESSQAETSVYPELCAAMVKDWRARWGVGEFPFYFVQLAAHGARSEKPGESRLARFREAQERCLQTVSRSGMVTALDIGDEKNVHPANKQEVGRRLALLALEDSYGRPVEGRSPVMVSASAEGGVMRVKIRSATPLESRNGAPQHFAVAGEDGVFQLAEARLDGECILVSSPQVPAPQNVRYAWADAPMGLNLYNAAGLPLLPFRTDKSAAPAPAAPRASAPEPAPAAVERVPGRPVLWLIGDSTVNNSTKGQMGWGKPFQDLLAPEKITLVNRARGGRSSRSFRREGLWEEVRRNIQKGDFVMMQFGHNDGGPIDREKARASLKGNADETRDVIIQETGEKETVSSYGGYLRGYITEARAAGATVIVLSPVPRNMWTDGRVNRAAADYGLWAEQAARQTGAVFVDLNDITARRYESDTQEKVAAEYFSAADHTHTTPAGAVVNARCVADGLRAAGISGFLK